jgi:predicted AAA+ superfamily ATPase
MSPYDWCSNYIRTYIERDVRQIKNIADLLQFEKFFRLIAGRSGQELNHSAIAVEAGIDVKTVQSWIGILESSFIIHLLPPFYNNYNKTIVKRPKLYLLDTALLCHLLGIHETTHLTTHPLRCAIFETMIVSELVKSRTHRGLPLNLYFWRDKTGHEIDVIMRINDKILPVEIKSGQTIIPEFFKNLNYWRKLSGVDSSLVLYGGQAVQERSDGTRVIPWRKWTI